MKTSEKFYGFTNYLVFPAVITRRSQLLKKIIQLYFPDIIIGELRTEKTHPEYFVPMLKQNLYGWILRQPTVKSAES